MLDVIGAGATAKSVIDWHNDVWKVSPESRTSQQEIEQIHAEGRSRPPVGTQLHSEFSTSWFNQTRTLLRRDFQSVWRNPTYVMAKFALNIVAGLLIGFTFWKSKATLQGTQNKVFAVFMALVVSVPMAQQLQIPFINMRQIYNIRERPSRMYSWTALLTSQLLVELPYNIASSSMFFLCWFWTVGFQSDRAGYTYLIMAFLMPIYYTSIGQATAAICGTVEVAALLFTFLFSFVLIFNGVLQPFQLLGWWKWMYRVSPYTYVVEGLLGQAIGRQEITCAPLEYVHLDPPSGESCLQYLDSYISAMGGYLTNPNATASCQFCAYRTSDQFLGTTFNVEYSRHWRDAGIFIGFIIINIVGIYAFTYLFQIKSWNFSKLFRRSAPKAREPQAA
jgi:ATP-binding cassette subfamily G (WHITE) protein 2 (SNQ2)